MDEANASSDASNGAGDVGHASRHHCEGSIDDGGEDSEDSKDSGFHNVDIGGGGESGFGLLFLREVLDQGDEDGGGLDGGLHGCRVAGAGRDRRGDLGAIR